MDRGTASQQQCVEALLTRLADGDQHAFAALYEQVAGQIYGLVNQILRCPRTSEKVAEEILLELWRTAPRYDPSRSSASAWIMTLAHRRAVDQVRNQQGTRARPATPDAALRRGRHRLSSALDQLTALQREVVELAYYGGYTSPEVAALLDAPLDTVESRMRDGLLGLRDALGPGSAAAGR